MGQKKLFENMFKDFFWNLPEVFVENAEETNTNRQYMGQLDQNDYPCSTSGLNFDPQGLQGNGIR